MDGVVLAKERAQSPESRPRTQILAWIPNVETRECHQRVNLDGKLGKVSIQKHLRMTRRGKQNG